MNVNQSKNKDNRGELYGIFNDSFPPILDGVTLTVQNYAHWLSKKGMTPCVVTPWNPESGEYPYDVMRYFSLPIWNRRPYRYGYPKLDPFIWKRLRKQKFSLVHAHCPFSSGRLGVYVKKKQDIPLIGTFHSKYRQDLEHSFRHAPWCVPIIMKRILDFFNACDEVWIPQAYVEETVREYGYKGKLSVMENGNDFADKEYFNPEGDIEEANKLLEEAGYPNGEGFPSIVLTFNPESGHGTIAQAVQDMWKNNLGIDVQLQSQEWKVFQTTRNNKDYEIARHGWVGDYVDPMTFLEMWLSTSGQNNAGYNNPKYDALVKAAKSEIDVEKRLELMHQAEDIIMEDMPIIPVYYYTQPKGIKSYVKDVRVSPLGFIYFDRAYIEGK